jgi:hypothetical protein
MVMISLVTLAAYVWNSLRIEPIVKEIGEKEQLWYECFYLNQMLKGINDNRYVNTTEMDYVQCDQHPDNMMQLLKGERFDATTTETDLNYLSFTGYLVLPAVGALLLNLVLVVNKQYFAAWAKLISTLAQRMHTTKSVSKNNVVPDEYVYESPR